MQLEELILETGRRLAETCPKQMKAVLGFDGAVDEILEVVDTRAGLESYSPIVTISDFGHRVLKVAGLSTNMELVMKQLKIGGCGPNMASALINAGVSTTYIGAIGRHKPIDLFEDFYTQCHRAYPIGMPSLSHALEFDDGKIIMAKLETVKEITWEAILDQLSLEQLTAMLNEADIIAFVNWTETPYMHSIWNELISKVMPNMGSQHSPIIFFDLADPQKRDLDEIAACMDTIKQFSQFGRVVLGLNRKEATEVGTALGLQGTVPLSDLPLPTITEKLADAMELYGLVVHPTAVAAAVIGGYYYEVPGPYTRRPRLTTGAGDNFNGGTVLGLALGLEPRQALVLGAATSGFYVREARSPGFAELQGFLRKWADNVGKEF